jgi:hypothetical protein
MQKLYLTKCAMIVLSIISASIYGMEPQIYRKKTSKEMNTKIAAKEQETSINSYTRKISRHRYDSIDAAKQENNILWYTQITSEKKTAEAIKIAQRKLI